jgi:hypothetical protein
MATTKPRYSVLIPDDIGRAFKARLSSQYPNITGITEASIPNLIRFVVLINAGLPIEVAQKGLRNLNRSDSKLDNLPY